MHGPVDDDVHTGADEDQTHAGEDEGNYSRGQLASVEEDQHLRGFEVCVIYYL